MHWDTFKEDNCSTVGGYGGCRVSKVQAGTTSELIQIPAEFDFSFCS